MRKILEPEFERVRTELNLPADQRGVLIVDCWPVHTSAAFRDFMKQECPNIFLLYVPASKLLSSAVMLTLFGHAASCRYSNN